jgi:integrase/recombinase XerD
MSRRAHPWFRAFDGWWYVKIDGKQIKLVRGRDSREAAHDRWHALMAERAANPPIDSPDQTVASIIDVYLSHIARRRSPRTYAECKRYLQWFAEAHGYRLVRECKPIHLTEWIDSKPEWKSDWTIATRLDIVNRPFNWAVRQGLIANNPFRSVKHRVGEPRRPVTDKEFWALLRATAPKRPTGRKRRRRPTAGERFRQVLFFLRYTGARPGELSALRWDEVDLDKRVIVLRHHKTSRMQSKYRPRVIPLVKLVVKLLRRIRHQESPEAERVFLTGRRTAWNKDSLGLRLRRLRERVGLPESLKLYGVRHGFGTKSILNGVPVKTLSEIMGHTSVRMTEHYIHLAGQVEHLADAMQRAVLSRRDT